MIGPRGKRSAIAVVVVAGIATTFACKKKEETRATAAQFVLGEQESPPPGPCAEDGDCALVAVADCCVCCPGSGVSGVAKGAPQYTRRCTSDCKRCVGSGNGGAEECRGLGLHPLSEYRVACREGRCVALLRDGVAPVVDASVRADGGARPVPSGKADPDPD